MKPAKENSEKAKILTANIINQNIDKMDDNNKKAATIMKNEGIESSVKHMLMDHTTGLPLTYAEMRARYG